ncbi:MAG: hypothetical protein PUB28_00805 [Roseburia sp.]|nr:hypothetical protein [Roseburia sp.]
MELIDGFFGKNHVTAAQMGDCLSGEIGLDKYVLNVGTKFKATVVSNNLITLESGVLCDQGRRAVTPHGNVESIIIENGAQGMNRNDLIAFHYFKDNASSVESGEFCVIKGQEAVTAKDPTYTTGNIREGATEDYFPLYRVKIVGLSITSVEPLFDVLASLKELKDKCSALNESLTNFKNLFSTNFKYYSTDYIDYNFCSRAGQNFMEFNTTLKKAIPANTWTKIIQDVPVIPSMATFRAILIGDGVPAVIHIRPTGGMALYSTKDLQIGTQIITGFSYI